MRPVVVSTAGSPEAKIGLAADQFAAVSRRNWIFLGVVTHCDIPLLSD
jgi:hypothetical protein